VSPCYIDESQKLDPRKTSLTMPNDNSLELMREQPRAPAAVDCDQFAAQLKMATARGAGPADTCKPLALALN
jgi:hypothetical protein